MSVYPQRRPVAIDVAVTTVDGDGFHSGRPVYCVTCRRCGTVVHDKTTGPLQQADFHTREECSAAMVLVHDDNCGAVLRQLEGGGWWCDRCGFAPDLQSTALVRADATPAREGNADDLARTGIYSHPGSAPPAVPCERFVGAGFYCSRCAWPSVNHGDARAQMDAKERLQAVLYASALGYRVAWWERDAARNAWLLHAWCPCKKPEHGVTNVWISDQFADIAGASLSNAVEVQLRDLRPSCMPRE